MNHTHTGKDFDDRRPGRRLVVEVDVDAADAAVGAASKSNPPADLALAGRAGGRLGGAGVAPRGVAAGFEVGFADGAEARGAGAGGRVAGGFAGRPVGAAVPVGRGGAGRFAPGLGARIVLLVRVLSESVLPVSETSETDIASPASSGRITA